MTPIKKLLDEQKLSLFKIVSKLDNGSHSAHSLQAIDEDIFDWHKQSIIALIREQIKRNKGTLNANAYLHCGREVVMNGYDMALKDDISYLEEVLQELEK
jgi:hypothetical protein